LCQEEGVTIGAYWYDAATHVYDSTLCVCSTNCANFTKQGLVAGGAITQSQANGLSIVPNDEFYQLEQYAPENSDSNGNAKVTETQCDTLPDGTQNCHQD
jgi:hypothetical protein